MKITYDPEADALYIELKDAEAEDNIDLEPGMTADLDKDGHIIAIEVLRASKRLGSRSLGERCKSGAKKTVGSHILVP